MATAPTPNSSLEHTRSVNRRDLHVLTRVRLDEARLLLDAGRYDGAYYLSGYVVECALKACIARQVRTHDFPPKPGSVRDMYTHDLASLVKAAGLVDSIADRIRSCPAFENYWGIMGRWTSTLGVNYGLPGEEVGEGEGGSSESAVQPAAEFVGATLALAGPIP